MGVINLLDECKKGLNIPLESTDFDAVLSQKILTVKMFLKRAGVNDENLSSDLAVGVIVLGVSDLWELKAGEVRFSPVFLTLTNQLAAG